jgi:hypothetical protein
LNGLVRGWNSGNFNVPTPLVIGNIDGVLMMNGTPTIRGWSCVVSVADSNFVQAFLNGNADAPQEWFLDETWADQPSEDGVNAACGAGTNHRFTIPLDAELIDPAMKGTPIMVTGIGTYLYDQNPLGNNGVFRYGTVGTWGAHTCTVHIQGPCNGNHGLDNYNGEDIWGENQLNSGKDQAECIRRAEDYFAYCLQSAPAYTTFDANGAVGGGNFCYLEIQKCFAYPTLNNSAALDTWGMQWEGTGTNGDACAHRVDEWVQVCGDNSVIRTTFGPTGIHTTHGTWLTTPPPPPPPPPSGWGGECATGCSTP